MGWTELVLVRCLGMPRFSSASASAPAPAPEMLLCLRFPGGSTTTVPAVLEVVDEAEAEAEAVVDDDLTVAGVAGVAGVPAAAAAAVGCAATKRTLLAPISTRKPG